MPTLAIPAPGTNPCRAPFSFPLADKDPSPGPWIRNLGKEMEMPRPKTARTVEEFAGDLKRKKKGTESAGLPWVPVGIGAAVVVCLALLVYFIWPRSSNAVPRSPEQVDQEALRLEIQRLKEIQKKSK